MKGKHVEIDMYRDGRPSGRFVGELVCLEAEGVEPRVAIREEGTAVGWVLMDDRIRSEMEVLDDLCRYAPVVDPVTLIDGLGRCFEGDDEFNAYISEAADLLQESLEAEISRLGADEPKEIFFKRIDGSGTHKRMAGLVDGARVVAAGEGLWTIRDDTGEATLPGRALLAGLRGVPAMAGWEGLWECVRDLEDPEILGKACDAPPKEAGKIDRIEVYWDSWSDPKNPGYLARIHYLDGTQEDDPLDAELEEGLDVALEEALVLLGLISEEDRERVRVETVYAHEGERRLIVVERG